MSGIEAYRYMQQLARHLDGLQDPGEIETALDEVEYLCEVLDPELQDAASDLIERLRAMLQRVRHGAF
jgi:hypothetical protein